MRWPVHVPKKLCDFFDSGILQLFEFERFLFLEALLGEAFY